MIKKLAARSISRLGFVLRSAYDFHDPVRIKVLLNALISKLEASAIAWSPYESIYPTSKKYKNRTHIFISQ